MNRSSSPFKWRHFEPENILLRVVNLDASLFRDFKLTEHLKMQFRTEVFNVTNTPAFNNPGTNASAPTRRPDGTIINLNGYTEITSAQATERQFRFALKFLFLGRNGPSGVLMNALSTGCGSLAGAAPLDILEIGADAK